MKLSKLSVSTVMTSVLKYGAHIFFMLGIIVMSYLSFVDTLTLDPSIRNITTIALVALVLNYMLWDSYYISNYNTILANDIDNATREEAYCIHRRYYNARKGWEYQPLQKRIRMFNQDFVRAYIEDIEDITGRKEEDIVSQPYKYKYTIQKGKRTKEKKKSYPHWPLIWRLKHKKYPKSGIKNSRQMLSVLRVGKSGSMSIKTNAAEAYHNIGRFKKIIMSALGALLAAALVYDFIQGDIKSALLKLVLNIVLLFMSFFTGSVSGIKGAQMKLSVAEEVSERLEEWKGIQTAEEPYKTVPKVVISEEILPVSVPEENPIVIEFT